MVPGKGFRGRPWNRAVQGHGRLRPEAHVTSTETNQTVKMHWQDHGGNGPCLLMVHGILSSTAQWLDNLPALADCCRPITVELWGHGQSPTPQQRDAYHPGHWVTQFETIRKALGVERWFLLGCSLGAAATIRYALAHPERTLGHIFTNSASAFADPARLPNTATAAEATAEKLLLGGRAALERIAMHPKHARRLPPRTHAALMDDAAGLSPTGVANILRYSTPHLSVRDGIAENTTPALLICGRREKRFLPNRDYAAAHMPQLTIADLDAGHGVNMEDPENFNALAHEFIERWQDS